MTLACTLCEGTGKLRYGYCPRCGGKGSIKVHPWALPSDAVPEPVVENETLPKTVLPRPEHKTQPVTTLDVAGEYERGMLSEFWKMGGIP